MQKVISTILFIIVVGVYTTESKPYPKTIEARVIEVIDGNTIRLEDPEEEQLQIVLEFADSPEAGQTGYEEAKEFLVKKLNRKKISVSIKGKDRYGNLVGQIEYKGKDIGTELVSKGLAWATVKAPESVKDAQDSAQSQSLGLWLQSDNEPPWVYKRKATLNQAKGS